MKTGRFFLGTLGVLIVGFNQILAAQAAWSAADQRKCSDARATARTACAGQLKGSPAKREVARKTETVAVMAPSPAPHDDQFMSLIRDFAANNAKLQEMAIQNQNALAQVQLEDARARTMQAEANGKLADAALRDADTRSHAQEADAALGKDRLTFDRERLKMEIGEQRRKDWFQFAEVFIGTAGYAGGQALHKPDRVAVSATGGSATGGNATSNSASSSTSSASSESESNVKVVNNNSVCVDDDGHRHDGMNPSPDNKGKKHHKDKC